MEVSSNGEYMGRSRWKQVFNDMDNHGLRQTADATESRHTTLIYLERRSLAPDNHRSITRTDRGTAVYKDFAFAACSSKIENQAAQRLQLSGPGHLRGTDLLQTSRNGLSSNPGLIQGQQLVAWYHYTSASKLDSLYMVSPKTADEC